MLGLGAFLFSFFLSQTAAWATDTFCVQTFNAYTPAYASSIWDRLERASYQLAEENCDAIQFQELWKQSHFEQMKKGLTPFGYVSVQADSIRNDSSIIGIASAFKGSIASAYSERFLVNNEGGVLDWIRNLAGVQKGFTAMTVKLDNAPLTLFLNLHTHPSDETIRVTQLLQLVEYVYKRSTNAATLPIILNGDLNATPFGIELEILKNLLLLNDAYVDANGAYNNVCTYCASNPLSWSSEDRVIDYVLYHSSSKVSLRVESAEVNLRGEAGAPLSDHFGVKSIFQWEEKDSTLLPIENELVRYRLQAAIATLDKVIQLLSNTTAETYKPIREIAIHLKHDLESGNLTAGMESLFRLP